MMTVQMQTRVRLQTRLRIGWGLWLKWVLILAAFTCVAMLGSDGVERPLVKRAVSDPLVREGLMVLGLAASVAALGFAQGLVLRRYLDGAGWWGLAIGATVWVGSSVTELIAYLNLDLLLAGFVVDFLLGGPICGVLQWLILRRQV